MHYHEFGRIAVALVLLGAMNVTHASAADGEPNQVDPGQPITEFSLPTAGSLPGGIVAGRDGALWFYETGTNQIGRMSADGQLSEFPIVTANASQPRQGFLAEAPDGGIWFTENLTSSLGRLTADGRMTEMPIDLLVRNHVPTAAPNPLLGLTAGPDGQVWFTGAISNSIWRLGPDGQTTEFVLPTRGATPGGIVVGSDGALWFAELTANQIGRITTDGSISEYPIPTPNSFTVRLARGSDGAVWFAEIRGNKIGRITTDGQIREYAVPDMAPVGITAGPDGAVWFTGYSSNEIGRVTPDGAIARFPVPTPKASPYHIAVGSDGALWFTEMDGNKIGRLEIPVESTRPVTPSTGLEPLLTIRGGPEPFGALPNGLAVDAHGNVYIGEGSGAGTVHVFDAQGTPLANWGGGPGSGEFIGPSAGGPDAIAVDAVGNVYATDPANYRVQKFDSDGNFLGAFGSIGQGQGQFLAGPYGLAVDRAGNVYASDLTGTVQKFDGSSGQVLARWEKTGATRLIAVDDVGDIFIRDDANRSVVRYRQR